jgi:hypothetical protein
VIEWEAGPNRDYSIDDAPTPPSTPNPTSKSLVFNDGDFRVCACCVLRVCVCVCVVRCVVRVVLRCVYCVMFAWWSGVDGTTCNENLNH